MAQLGFQVVILGIGMVGLILGLLVISTTLLGKVSNSRVGRTKEEHIAPSSAPRLAETSDKDLIVAITAAIYQMLSLEQTEKSDLDFVVRSIKRI